MNVIKRIFTVVCCLLFIGVSTFGVSAIPNTSNWPSLDLQKRGNSNSDFDEGTFSYKYDYDSNQIQLWFFLKYLPGSNGDVNNAGVVININNLGNITVTDKVAGYDEFVYNVEYSSKNRMYDQYSKSLSMGFTVGVKDGLSDKDKISIYILDLQGKRSNVYTFNIGNTTATTTSAQNKTTRVTTTKATTSKTTKVTTSKTTKPKTTKLTTSKTTKPKTTKAATVKTSKAKTTKAATVKTSRTTKAKTTKSSAEKTVSETLVEQTEMFVPTQNIKVDEKISEKSENNRKVILIFGATATIIAVISGCAIGIRNKRKK